MAVVDQLLQYGVPSLGVVLATAIYASSFPVVRQARILRDMRQLDAVTLTMQFLTTQSWIEYARVVHDPFIWACNCIGFFLTTFYVVTLLELAVANGQLLARGKVEVIYGVGLLVLVTLATLNSFVFVSEGLRATVSGVIANVFTILMAIAPALNIAAAIRQKSAACIQIGLNVASFLNALTWTSYGIFVKNDPYIYVSNGIGLLCSTAQLLTVMVFFKSDQAQRKKLHKVKSLQKLKTDAIQEEYERRYGEHANLVPLEFNSEFLADRLNLRAETGLLPTAVERHETAATALLGRPIQNDMAEAVLRDLALSDKELAMVVRVPEGEGPESDTSAPESPQTMVHNMLAGLHDTVGVVCQPATDEEAPKLASMASAFTVSLYPKESYAVLGELRQSLTGMPSFHQDPTASRPTLELRLGHGGSFTLSCKALPDAATPGARPRGDEA